MTFLDYLCEVTDCEPLSGYRLKVACFDGAQGVFDMTNYFHRGHSRHYVTRKYSCSPLGGRGPDVAGRHRHRTGAGAFRHDDGHVGKGIATSGRREAVGGCRRGPARILRVSTGRPFFYPAYSTCANSGTLYHLTG